MIEHQFSDLLRHPKEVTGDVEDGDVLLRRRDEPDLRLSRADREVERAEAFSALTRTFRNLAVHNRTVLDGALADAFPWLEFLPARDRRLFSDEFSRVVTAAADLDNYAPLGQLLPRVAGDRRSARGPASGPTPPPARQGLRRHHPRARVVVPKRRERVAPPPTRRGWDFRYATNEAVSGSDKVCAAAPADTRTAWERITADPRHRDARQHPLKGALGTRAVNGETTEQWQYEVSGAGRLWYCIDDRHRTVWLTEASPGHPKVTE